MVMDSVGLIYKLQNKNSYLNRTLNSHSYKISFQIIQVCDIYLKIVKILLTKMRFITALIYIYIFTRMKDQKKPQVIYVIGGPGSGKGTQCQLLTDNFADKFVHLSTGSLLREATQIPTLQNKYIVDLMKDGQMVPSKYLIGLVKQRIRNCIRDKQNTIYILDGYPRNMENIKVWNEIIGTDFDVKFLLYYQCTQQELLSRLRNRAKTSKRVDDTPEGIKKRLVVFNEETKPILEDFEQHGKILSIDANKSIEEVNKATITTFKENGILA